MIDTEALARTAYTAYRKATDGRNHLGQLMPAWEDLGETISAAWQDAAQAITVTAAAPAPEDLYRERAQLVAYLASRFPAVIAYSDPAEPDWPVIYIIGPTGQMSWHLHRSDLPLFPHVPTVPADNPRAQWDGHSTPEKYQRLANLTEYECQ